MNNTDEHLAKKKKKITSKNKSKTTKNIDVKTKKKNVNLKRKKETVTPKKRNFKKETSTQKATNNRKRKENNVEKKKTNSNVKKRQEQTQTRNIKSDSKKQQLNKKNKEAKKSSNDTSKERPKKKNKNTNQTQKTVKKTVKKRKSQKKKKVIETIKFLIPIFLLLTAMGLFQLKTAVHTVDGDSMKPALLDGDRVIVSKGKEIERYEIITFDPPIESEYKYVKRVIGMPEDSIWITGNHLFINPKKNLKQSYSELIISFIDELPDGTLKLDISNDCAKQLEGLKNIPEGKYFVLGDNRENSSDSREFGLVDQYSIEGAVFFRVGPLNRFGFIK